MARKKATPPATQEAYPRTQQPLADRGRNERNSRETIREFKIEDGNNSSSSSTRSPPTPKAIPKKRKSTAARRASVAKTVDTPSDAFADTITDTITDTIADVFSFFFSFICSIFSTAIKLIRKPLTILFSIYFVAVTIAWIYQFAQIPIFMALSPICRIPGVSFFDVPFCEYTRSTPKNSGRPRGKSDFPELINLQANFDSILENSLGGSHMAMELKKSEIAVRDLSTLVRVSDLLMCREELSARLDDFVQTAKSTSRGLSRFGSRVNGVVDSLLAMDEYALRALERARISQSVAISGNVITSWALAPFKPWNGYVEAERDILATFVLASSVMDNNIQRLIREAQLVVKDLDELEDRLEVIQEMVSREHGVIKNEYHEVLAQLWTILGGNRQKLVNFASHHTLLSSITAYRSKALHHVGSSLVQLQQMQTDLEDLRDRVAEPALLADAGKQVQDIPLEVHIESIRKGLERLNTGRDKVKGIENSYMKKVIGMHDEAINALERSAAGTET